jgi:hypothetical protein
MKFLKSKFILILSIVSSLLIFIHISEIYPFHWKYTQIENITHNSDNLYSTSIKKYHKFSFIEPKYVVLENKKELIYPHSPKQHIRELGLGRYLMEGSSIYFSTSDNSNPTTNSRLYEIKQAYILPSLLIVVIYSLLFMSLLLRLNKIKHYILNISFRDTLIVFTFFFIIYRLWFFVDYPLVAVHPDSGNYYAMSEEITNKILPEIGVRPPMYPIFLSIVFYISNSLYSMAFFQTILSYISGSILLYSLYLYNRFTALVACVVLLSYYFSLQVLEHDTAMLSESLYTSLIISSFGILFIGLLKNKGYLLAVSSTLMALAILTRPAGLFLVVPFFILTIWIYFKNKNILFHFIIPFILILLLTSLYNLNRVKAFTPTTWGEANLAVATFLIWEENKNYSDSVNNDIRRIKSILENRLESQNKNIDLLNNSWNISALSAIFVESFNGEALNIAMNISNDNYGINSRKLIRTISIDSILNKPIIYSKFVVTMLINYYKPATELDVREYLINRAWMLYIVKPYSSDNTEVMYKRMIKEFNSGEVNKKIIINDYNTNNSMNISDRIVIPSDFSFKFYLILHKIKKIFFTNWIWPSFIFIGFFVSLVILIRSKFNDLNSFVLFLVCLSSISSALVVSLVEYSQPRYSYPMEWSNYFAFIFLISIFCKNYFSSINMKFQKA